MAITLNGKENLIQNIKTKTRSYKSRVTLDGGVIKSEQLETSFYTWNVNKTNKSIINYECNNTK